jgi:hypothetical protein
METGHKPIGAFCDRKCSEKISIQKYYHTIEEPSG